MKEYEEIVCRLLGFPPGHFARCNISLADYLDDIAAMVNKAGGQLVSRQAIAIAINCWQQQTHKDPVADR